MSNNGNPAQKRKATASVDEEDKRGVKRLDNGNQFRKEMNHYDSRIVRVSRASGGKDRHSKVLTAKGLRDRRVRLSVSTAIQFYDLQDRLGFDQPSKALEWLIKAAADAIDQLPALQMPINANGIAYHPSNRVAASNQLTSTVALTRRAEKVSPDSASSDESNRVKRHVVDEDKTLEEIPPRSNSGGTSEGGENSSAGLSLCRSDSRLKARERAKERANIKGKGLKIKEKSLSFTDLLQNVVSIESQEINNNSSTRQDNDPGPVRNENDINSMKRENNNSNTLRRQNDPSSMRREEAMNQVQIVQYHDQNGSYQQQNNVMEQTALGLVSSDHSSQNFSFSSNNIMISNNNKQPSGLAFMANAFPIVGNPIIHGNCSALMQQGGGATGTTSHSQHEQMMSFSPISSRETLQSNSYNNLMMNYYMQSQHPQSLLHRLNQLIAGGHIHAYDAVRIMERPMFQLDSVDASSRSDVKADRKPSHPSYN